MKEESGLKKLIKQNSDFLRTPVDLSILFGIILLNVYGLIMIYSASYYYASAHKLATSYFFVNQLRWSLIGIVLMVLLSFIKPTVYKKDFLIVASLILGILLIPLVRFPYIGHSVNGAYRWIKIGGLTLQIAEPVKVLIIVGLAGIIASAKVRNRRFAIMYFIYIGLAGLLLFVISNNLSTAMIVVIIGYIMLMLAYPKAKPFVIAIIVAVLLAVIAVFVIAMIPEGAGENFRFTRIRAWLDPESAKYSSDEAFQATQALYAIASGGFFGKGLGQSLIKFKLPEPHNDYILSIIFEELGIVGVVLLTALFVFLLIRVFKVYRETKDLFLSNIVLGVFIHIAVQVTMNYCVTLGLLPTMGVTLPFISQGGSSCLFLFIELGLVLAINRYNNELSIRNEAIEDQKSKDPYFKKIVERKSEEKA